MFHTFVIFWDTQLYAVFKNVAGLQTIIPFPNKMKAPILQVFTCSESTMHNILNYCLTADGDIYR